MIAVATKTKAAIIAVCLSASRKCYPRSNDANHNGHNGRHARNHDLFPKLHYALVFRLFSCEQGQQFRPSQTQQQSHKQTLCPTNDKWLIELRIRNQNRDCFITCCNKHSNKCSNRDFVFGEQIAHDSRNPHCGTMPKTAPIKGPAFWVLCIKWWNFWLLWCSRYETRR